MARRKYIRQSSGPLLRLCGTCKVFGLTDKQIAEWYRKLADLRPRQRIYLEDKP